MLLKKNTIVGKTKSFFVIFFFSQFLHSNLQSETKKNSEMFADLNVLDKVSSKSSNLTIKIGEEFKFQNLIIKVLKCYNSEFDDDPEVTAYMQVKDLTIKNKDKVFFFNDWTFASSPSIRPFDHPVYDIWLKKCYS
mgnify:CR=1 FL=1|tara:strand:- start:651 stop:1058 length:408 start_codon:yes stop_codon:yes gene_type:complete